MEFDYIGNIEFLHLFLMLYYQKYEKIDEFNYLKLLLTHDEKVIFYQLIHTYDLNKIYYLFFEEARNRGLNISASSDTLLCNELFLQWINMMKDNPTFIREVQSFNYLGDRKLLSDFDFSTLDFPVRKACQILNDKGYITYWSSANYCDAVCRTGDIIKGKNVAYILIDSTGLDEELKEILALNEDIYVWGRALNHCDNGNYYGIYVEIESLDMLCVMISEALVLKALELPILRESFKKGK